MKIIFDEKPGEIFDFFQSLWILNNLEENDRIKNEYGNFTKNRFEEALIGNEARAGLYSDKIEKYFYPEVTPDKLMSMTEVWEKKTVGNFLEFLSSFNEEEYLDRIFYTFLYIADEENPKIDKEELKEEVIESVAKKPISKGLKWEIFLLLRNPLEYLEKYLDFLKSYNNYYDMYLETRDEVLKEYNTYLEKGIKEAGADFINEEIGNTFKFPDNIELRVTTSALSGLRILKSNKHKDIYYLIIGPYLDAALKSLLSEDEIENNLTFIRSMAESTRFKILKLLMVRDHYGQEMVDKLKMNKTTVFYHLDYLLALNIVTISRDSQRNYYSLNNEEISKNLKLFMGNFKQNLN